MIPDVTVPKSSMYWALFRSGGLTGVMRASDRPSCIVTVCWGVGWWLAKNTRQAPLAAIGRAMSDAIRNEVRGVRVT
ncbi:hypothetical protein [Humibacter ginsengiterrae]